MKRLLAAALLTVAAFATTASAWPPVCKPLVYDTTGICV